MKQSERFNDLDALRGILMVLGIVLHSANIFSPNTWAIQNIETSHYYQHLVDFIHAFRMPAFFIVSGFFLHFSYQRHGASIILNQRVPRIIIPLIVTAITLNSLQYSFLNASSELLNFGYWTAGYWISHLWFLNVLVYYFVFAYLGFHYLPKVFEWITKPIDVFLKVSPHVFVLLMPAMCLITLKVSYLIPEAENGRYYFSLAEAIKYSPYFIFGLLLHANIQLRSKFFIFRTGLMLLSIFVGLAVLNGFTNLKIIHFIQSEYLTWALSALSFAFFHQYMNRSKSWFTKLSNASYTIYLFHHIFVILFGSMIIQLSIPMLLKFLLIMGLTFITTYLIHSELVSKLDFMSFLFNGKHLPNKGQIDKSKTINELTN